MLVGEPLCAATKNYMHAQASCVVPGMHLKMHVPVCQIWRWSCLGRQAVCSIASCHSDVYMCNRLLEALPESLEDALAAAERGVTEGVSPAAVGSSGSSPLAMQRRVQSALLLGASRLVPLVTELLPSLVRPV